MSSSLEELKQNYDVEIFWRSFELRPKGAPPIPPEYRARIEASRPMLYQRAREEYGIELDAGPFGIDSRPSLIIEKYADAQGVGKQYHRAVERSYWEEGKDISDPDVLKACMKEAGLNPEQYDAVMADPQYEAEVDQDIHQAHMYGLQGVPAVVFENKYLVSGAQPTDVFRQVTEQILAEVNGESAG